MLARLKQLLAILGPGIFAIGYTIGTGSVTSMAKAGADSGLGMLWVLALSCLFSGVLMNAYGRYAAVTGETALYALKSRFKWGKWLAVAILVGIVTAQYTCMGGILAISSGAIAETLAMFFPSVNPSSYALTVGIAGAVIAVMFGVMMIGRYALLEKILAAFVFVMALTFMASVFATCPDAPTLARAAAPIFPHSRADLLMFAAFVGTTMAAPTFVTRPLIIREKNLGPADLPRQRTDSAFSATLMFVISGSILFVATGALWAHGKGIVKILDMVHTLEPLAGKFAVAIFMLGTLSAGLSSIFPIMMVAPLLIGDYRSGKMDTRSRAFRLICLGASLFAMLIPALGANPILITVMAQVSNVFVLPLTVIAIMILSNAPGAMGPHRPRLLANLSLAAALIFSLAVAIAGANALKTTISTLL